MMSTKTHGVIDYIYGIVLLLAPWIFGFSHDRAASAVPIVIGLVALVQALCTDYELGAIRLIPMRIHLGMDALIGVILLLSPWLFGFSQTIVWPHVLVGLLLIVASFTTEREPSREWRAAHHH